MRIHALPGGASSRGPHRLADAMLCERKWRWRYLEGFDAKEEPPYRRIGTAFHLCASYYWASQLTVRPAWFAETPLREALVEAVQGDSEMLARVTGMFTAWRRYMTAYPRKPVAVEEELFLKLPNGEIVTCRVDLIAEENGWIWVYDIKTTARGGWGSEGASERLPRWQENGPYALDWQSLIVLRAARAKFGADRVRGYMLDRVKQTEPFDFDTPIVDVPLEPYEEAVETAMLACAREHEHRTNAFAGKYPVGNFAGCYHGGAACDYRYVCRSPRAARVQLLDEDFHHPAAEVSTPASATDDLFEFL